MSNQELTIECGCVRNPSEQGKYVGSLKTLCDTHSREVRLRSADEAQKLLSDAFKGLMDEIENGLSLIGQKA